ncbi:helix-turn-helix transcriptional regulator [Desulfosporosinus sp. BG]|uniref:helix-turn-helix domain-containing protein n=1 Tax=Desulfosporosinus sp. BG TaxID=1633135 RepID=UPI00083A4A94|nr:helix-turn-helix transcriptional regulator [Desulfosporosinus sp. BG]
MLDKKALGEFIKQKRKEKGLRQNQVSLIANLSRNYVSDIENGRYMPSVETLSRLATCLDLDLNSLKMTEIQVSNIQQQVRHVSSD